MKEIGTLCLPLGKEYVFIHPTEIKYIESEGSYANFHLNDGNSYMVSKNLKHIEGLVNPEVFMRIHKSIIVNLNCAKRIVVNGTVELELKDGARIPLSRRKKSEFLSRFKRV